MSNAPAPTTRLDRDFQLAEASTWEGFRSARFARSTGSMIVVVDGFEQGMEDANDKQAPRWFTICDTHGNTCGHRTLAAATSWASAPEGWCEGCSDVAR